MENPTQARRTLAARAWRRRARAQRTRCRPGGRSRRAGAAARGSRAPRARARPCGWRRRPRGLCGTGPRASSPTPRAGSASARAAPWPLATVRGCAGARWTSPCSWRSSRRGTPSRRIAPAKAAGRRRKHRGFLGARALRRRPQHRPRRKRHGGRRRPQCVARGEPQESRSHICAFPRWFFPGFPQPKGASAQVLDIGWAQPGERAAPRLTDRSER